MVTSMVIFTANYKTAKATQDGIADDKALPQLVQAAAVNHQKYVIENVTMRDRSKPASTRVRL